MTVIGTWVYFRTGFCACSQVMFRHFCHSVFKCWFKSWPQRICQTFQYCCGDAWNRKCCHSRKGFDPDLTIVVSVSSASLALVFIGITCTLHHRRKRSRHYIKLVNWIEAGKPQKGIPEWVIHWDMCSLTFVSRRYRTNQNKLRFGVFTSRRRGPWSALVRLSWVRDVTYWNAGTYIDILYTKMILWPSRTSWWWSQTSITDDADARHADVFIATLLSLRDTLIET